MNIKNIGTIFWVTVLACVIAFGVALRVEMYQLRRGYSGEDTFSLLQTSKALTNFRYPATEKRLPLYPMLLMPVANQPVIAIEYGKILNVVFGSLTLIVVAVLAYVLSQSYFAAFLATVLTATSMSLVVVSARALTDGLFILLNTSCILAAFVYGKYLQTKPDSTKLTPKKSASQKFALKNHLPSILFGLLLGLNAMTRFEGFLTAAIFLSTYALVFRRRFQTIFIAGMVCAIIVTPWFIKNTIQYGNPLSSPYAQDAEYGIKDGQNFVQKTKDGLQTLPRLFVKFDPDAPKMFTNVLSSHDPLRWKSHLLTTEVIPKLSVYVFAYGMIVFGLIGAYRLLRQNLAFGLAYGAEIFVLYSVAAFIWLRIIARFYNSQLPLMAVIAAVGVAAVLEWIKKIPFSILVQKGIRALFIVIILYSLHQQFLVVQKELDGRMISEHADTADSAVYLQALGDLSQRTSHVITNIQDHNALPFYVPRVDYTDTLPVKSCPPKTCIYFVKSSQPVATQSALLQQRGTLLSTYQQKTAGHYLLLYQGL